MFGSRNSSKNGWHIASTADKRCVGVYSKSLEIKSIASGLAFLNTYEGVSYGDPGSTYTNAADLREWVWLDLWELMLHVVGVHGSDLFASRCTEDLDDFHELIDSRLSGEEWLTEHQFRHDASRRPNICKKHKHISLSSHHTNKIHVHNPIRKLTNLWRVVLCSKDQLGGPVVSRTNIGNIWFVFHQDLCATEIAELENTGRRVKKKVLWLDISVADALGVDVGERSEELVDVEFDLQRWHCRLQLVEVTRCSVDGLWYKLQHQVEVNLVFLRKQSQQTSAQKHATNVPQQSWKTYSLSVGIVKGLQFDNVWVPDDSHDLQFTVLCIPSISNQIPLIPSMPLQSLPTVGYGRKTCRRLWE